MLALTNDAIHAPGWYPIGPGKSVTLSGALRQPCPDGPTQHGNKTRAQHEPRIVQHRGPH
jgi:hypothetical protein